MLQGIEDAVRSKFNRIDKCILRVNSWINGGSGTVIICKNTGKVVIKYGCLVSRIGN